MSVDKLGTGTKCSNLFPISNEKFAFMGKRSPNVGYPPESNDAVNKLYVSDFVRYDLLAHSVCFEARDGRGSMPPPILSH